MILRFGIPSLDELLSLPAEQAGKYAAAATAATAGAAKRQKPDRTVESYAIVGADGSGKSVLALHMASRYHADCWALTRNTTGPRTPRILYVSSDLRFGSALQVWKNFRLHRPNTRHVPFERIPDAMKRYWTEAEGYPRLCLRDVRPSSELPSKPPSEERPGPESISIIEYLLPSTEPESEARIGFLDLATNTAGDDWNFVNALLAKLESIPTAVDGNGKQLPHLVVVDSVLGFETFVGRLDAYGTEQSRRARIAQCMRNAGTHCHLLFVAEEPNEKEHLPEEYVTDVVLRLRQKKRGDGITRTLEIEKARARSHAVGEHPFEIRSKEGSSTRGWENADTPVTQNDYVHVLHSIPHRSALVAQYKGVDLPANLVARFGIPDLDRILGRGLSVGTCNALIGDASTGKSALAERFLAAEFGDLICQFIRVYARFQANSLESHREELNRSWLWVLEQLGGNILNPPKNRPPRRGRNDPALDATANPVAPAVNENPGQAVLDAVEKGVDRSVDVLKQEEYEDAESRRWIDVWKSPSERDRLRTFLKAGTGRPETRTDILFALSSPSFDPAGGAEAVLKLFDHPNLRWPAVLLTTSNKRAREFAVDCLVHYRNTIHQEMTLCFGDSQAEAWKILEAPLIRFLECQIIVRRFDIVDQPAPVVLHAIVRNLLEAKKLIFGPFFPTSQEKHKIKADRIRLVIDDMRVLCNTAPDVLKDSAFLSFLTFQLERSGITSLLVYSDAVRPDTRPEDETSRALMSLSKRSILVWRVPFEGRTRFALTLVPPTHLEHSEAIRELKLIQPQWDLEGEVKSKVGRILVPAVTPKFELYSGVEKGKPSPVPLAVYLYAETKPFAAYVEEENSLFRELFTSVEPGSGATPGSVIFPLDWTRYLAMRDYTHLSLDKLDNHTMVFQVDGSWAVGGKGALSQQEDYLNQEFSTDEDERSAQDPFHLFEGGASEKPRRRDYFRNSEYTFARHRTDRVPFMWDFGFILARGAPWQAAFGESLHGKLARGRGHGTAFLKQLDVAEVIVPFTDQNNLVKSVYDYLSDPHKDAAQRERGGLSWRRFFGACRSVADIHRAHTGAEAVAFDISASSPETINSLVLEIWFSEMLLEQKLRDAAPGSEDKPAKKEEHPQSLEKIMVGDCPRGMKIADAFADFKREYRKCAIDGYKIIREESGATAPEPEGHEATPVEKVKMFERRNTHQDATKQINDLFSALPLGAFCLYKTWLLLLEVFNFEDYFDPDNPFTFKLGRTASLQAVASRHWYKTACSYATQLYEAKGIHDAMVPFRLPGSFSTRGDWFLGSPGSSRSRLLARHAFDLLCSRRANLTRMQRGLGLPVRDVVLDDTECGNLRTALRCRIQEVELDNEGKEKTVVRSSQMPYGSLAKLGHCSGDGADGFRWLWRNEIEDYDRHSRTLQKWMARLFRWTVEIRETLADDWQGGFTGYDHLTCRRFAEVDEYPSFLKFAEHCDLLVAELKASSRKAH